MAAWAPEFLEFPRWAASAEIMFADAAGWIALFDLPSALADMLRRSTL
jgi:hypothetical protein